MILGWRQGFFQEFLIAVQSSQDLSKFDIVPDKIRCGEDTRTTVPGRGTWRAYQGGQTEETTFRSRGTHFRFPASEAKRLKAGIIDGLFLWGSSTVNDLSFWVALLSRLVACDHTAITLLFLKTNQNEKEIWWWRWLMIDDWLLIIDFHCYIGTQTFRHGKDLRFGGFLGALVPGDGAQHSQGMQPRGHRGASLALWIGQQVRWKRLKTVTKNPQGVVETLRKYHRFGSPRNFHVNQTFCVFFFQISMLLCHTELWDETTTVRNYPSCNLGWVEHDPVWKETIVLEAFPLAWWLDEFVKNTDFPNPKNWGRYTFFYMPFDKRRNVHCGFAFINFRPPMVGENGEVLSKCILSN